MTGSSGICIFRFGRSNPDIAEEREAAGTVSFYKKQQGKENGDFQGELWRRLHQ